MTLRLVRVDDRLVHGQITVGWLAATGAALIVVVDDQAARDDFLREVLCAAAPPGITVDVCETSSAVARLVELATGGAPVLVLVRSPVTALHLREQGVDFAVLNVGGIGAGHGRRRIHKSVSVSPAEWAAMRRIEELGTRVVLQQVPEARAVPLASLSYD